MFMIGVFLPLVRRLVTFSVVAPFLVLVLAFVGLDLVRTHRGCKYT